MASLFDKREDKQFIHSVEAFAGRVPLHQDVRMAPCLIEIQQERQAGSDAARAANYRDWPS
jgi:hypothetical protein